MSSIPIVALLLQHYNIVSSIITSFISHIVFVDSYTHHSILGLATSIGPLDPPFTSLVVPEVGTPPSG